MTVTGYCVPAVHSLGFVTLQEKQGITKASDGSKEGNRAAKILHSTGQQRKAAACSIFLTFVFYHTPAVIWFPQHSVGRAKENSATSPFPRDTSNIFPQHRSPLLQILPICTQKQQVASTFSELGKNHFKSSVFSKILLVTVLWWPLKLPTWSERCLNDEASF